MTRQKEPVKITLTELKKQVENGMKRKELAEYYGIPETQMAKALKSVGLTIRKFHLPAFEIVADEKEDKAPEILETPFEEVEQLQMMQYIGDEENKEYEETKASEFCLEDEEEENPIFPPIANNPLNY